ncbi:MAG: hypothetical protein FWC26_10765 [Fibromonadales bacterium]|nr:hypothetical protein [Fibromonadales bacterium]
MKLIFPALFSLCFLACIDEYSDSITLHSDGSAAFFASIYPCEPDGSLIENIKANYDSIAGLKFDSAWFSQKDSLYALAFKLSFENLFSWQGDKKFEKDFIGNISLKKIDTLKNGYSFERVINPNTVSENGDVVPEEGISPFVLEQISGNDSAYWEYILTLPQGTMLISSDPIDTAYISQGAKSGVLRWRFPASEAISKRISLKADFILPEVPQKTVIHWPSLIGVVLSCVVMLLAIALLIRKLLRVSLALKKLKNEEKNLKGE